MSGKGSRSLQGLAIVLGANLPFTGISLWLAALVAVGLLAAGGALRRIAPRRIQVSE